MVVVFVRAGQGRVIQFDAILASELLTRAMQTRGDSDGRFADRRRGSGRREVDDGGGVRGAALSSEAATPQVGPRQDRRLCSDHELETGNVAEQRISRQLRRRRHHEFPAAGAIRWPLRSRAVYFASRSTDIVAGGSSSHGLPNRIVEGVNALRFDDFYDGRSTSTADRVDIERGSFDRSDLCRTDQATWTRSSTRSPVRRGRDTEEMARGVWADGQRSQPARRPLPTRVRADLVLRKGTGPQHRGRGVERVTWSRTRARPDWRLGSCIELHPRVRARKVMVGAGGI